MDPLTSLSWLLLIYQLVTATLVPSALPALRANRKAIYLVQFTSFLPFLAKHSGSGLLGTKIGLLPLLFNWFPMRSYHN